MVPKMALIRGNVGLDIRFLCSRPRKGTSFGGTACFGVFCVKIRTGPLPVASCKNPPKNQKLTRFGAQSHACAETIVTNLCTGVGVHDVITCADLYDSLTGFGRGEGVVKFWASPLTCVVALTTLSHYRASV